MKPKILVAYLLWTPGAVKPFLESYHAHPAGIDHDFLIIDKGSVTEAPSGYECFKIDDRGYDICAFGKLIPRSYRYDFIVKFNSSNLILADNWLLKLYEAMQTPEAGIAGTTGSWATARSMDGAVWRKLFYPSFPNPHVRTAGFMIASNVFRRIWPGRLWNAVELLGYQKFRYLPEHGRGNISQRIESLGLKLLLVDREGRVWEKADWEKSNTFRSGRQEGLLIADKQTLEYDRASPEQRIWMSDTTWKNRCQK